MNISMHFLPTLFLYICVVDLFCSKKKSFGLIILWTLYWFMTNISPTILNSLKMWAHYFLPPSLICKEHHSRGMSFWIVINHFRVFIKRNTVKYLSLQRCDVVNTDSFLTCSLTGPSTLGKHCSLVCSTSSSLRTPSLLGTWGHLACKGSPQDVLLTGPSLPKVPLAFCRISHS